MEVMIGWRLRNGGSDWVRTYRMEKIRECEHSICMPVLPELIRSRYCPCQRRVKNVRPSSRTDFFTKLKTWPSFQALLRNNYFCQTLYPFALLHFGGIILLRQPTTGRLLATASFSSHFPLFPSISNPVWVVFLTEGLAIQ